MAISARLPVILDALLKPGSVERDRMSVALAAITILAVTGGYWFYLLRQRVARTINAAQGNTLGM